MTLFCDTFFENQSCVTSESLGNHHFGRRKKLFFRVNDKEAVIYSKLIDHAQQNLASRQPIHRAVRFDNARGLGDRVQCAKQLISLHLHF